MLNPKKVATRRWRVNTLPTLAIIASVLVSGTAHAQNLPQSGLATDVNFEIESDGADRIVLAGKLRTLT